VEVKVDRERVSYWIERGAQPTATVRRLLKRPVVLQDSSRA
jgi:ribosomal protein S16